MKLKQLALVAMLSVAAPIAANAATYNFNFSTDWAAGTKIAELFTSGAYNSLLTAANIVPNPSGSQSVSITDIFHSLDGFVSDWTAQLNVRATALSGGAIQYSLLSETLFSTSNSAFGVIRSFETGGAVPTTTIAAVPGPEAGAGLGALAMGGMTLWLKRRRQGDQAAA